MTITESQNIPTDYTQVDTLMIRLIDTVSQYMKKPKGEIHTILWDTYIFARSAHEGQFRKSGEPYILHPVSACEFLLHLKPDIITIQSCILHDVIEDTPHDRSSIAKNFWEEVASICEGLSKLSAIKYKWEERTIESLRKMLVAMVQDLRVIIVKLADRMHNMRTLDFHPDPVKRERIALETLNIYAPIADRLGLFRMKEMLETECFRILHSEEYIRIMKELEGMYEEQEFFLEKANTVIRKVIPKNIPIIEISYRIKAPYSIYRKLSRKEYSYTNPRDLYDLFAIRIITQTIPQCYEVLGILHNVFIPMPKRFKDYIALPKENRYQSLHTTVVGLFPEVRSQPTEIQIRTPEMHLQAEIGIAAHFEYSETGTSKNSKDSYWVQTIKEIVGHGLDGWEFMKEMHMNVFSDQIFVFTPKGDIVTLPKWATPVDFAYAIHSRIGNELAIAKMNGQVIPLDYELKNGESIQIVTDKNRKPNPTWLSIAKTPKAREHIRQFINSEERSYFIEKGRSILNSYLEKNYGKWLDKDFSILKYMDGKTLDTKQKEDVLVQLGNLSRKPVSIVKALSDTIIKEALWERKIDDLPEKTKVKIKSDGSSSPIEEKMSIIIGKQKDIPYKMAHCCEPNIWDKIVGAIGQWIVTIHKFECENLEKVNLDRRIPANWSNDTVDGMIIIFWCIVQDRKGVMKEMTEIFYHMELNIEDIQIKTLPNRLKKNIFTLRSDDEDYYIYERLAERIRFAIPDIKDLELISIK